MANRDPGPPPEPGAALAPAAARLRLPSPAPARSVPSARRAGKRWEPPEGLAPEDVRGVIAAAEGERDRLLLRVLWATGARVSEALALRPLDVGPDHLVLPNRKNAGRPVKRVFLPASERDLPGALLVFQRDAGLAATDPLYCSTRPGPGGSCARRPSAPA